MKLGTLVFLLLIASGSYLAFAYLPPWMAYRAMNDQMVEQARKAAVLSDDEIADRLYAVVKEWGLPVTRDAIVVTRRENHVSIRTQWDVTIHHFGLYDHRLHFAPAADEMIMPVGR